MEPAMYNNAPALKLYLGDSFEGVVTVEVVDGRISHFPRAWATVTTDDGVLIRKQATAILPVSEDPYRARDLEEHVNAILTEAEIPYLIAVSPGVAR